MSGILYGIGTGPGDPELLTLKAVRKIRKVNVIAVPVSDMEYARNDVKLDEEQCRRYLDKCVAYQIALKEVPELSEKKKLFLPMPMMKEGEILDRAHQRAVSLIEGVLDHEEDIAFLTLGDPSVYSTYLYVKRRAENDGYQTEMISGIPSFCAAAAKLGTGLVENREELHILPASYQIEEGLLLSGTKVLMKAGKKMPEVKKRMEEHHGQVYMVTNCGMPGEEVYCGKDAMPEDAGYYSLVIVKEESK